MSNVGNFYGSTLVELKPGDPPAQTLSLIAGLALIETLDSKAPTNSLVLKWPNDVLMGSAKLAGILLERNTDRVVIGFGVNLASAPIIERRQCASLSGCIEPKTFAPLLQSGFEQMLGLWRRSEPMLVARAWLERAHPLGTRLRVHSSSEEVRNGSFEGIEADGALRLRTDDGVLEIVRAGDVEL